MNPETNELTTANLLQIVGGSGESLSNTNKLQATCGSDPEKDGGQCSFWSMFTKD